MPRLSSCFYFSEGVKDDNSATTRNTDSNKNSIRTTSITYPPETTGEVVYYSEKEKGSGYYNDSGFHTVMYVPAPRQIQTMPGQPINFNGSVVIQATLEEDPQEQDWFTLQNTLSVFNEESYSNKMHNFLGNYVWIRAKVTISSGVLQKISINH